MATLRPVGDVGGVSTDGTNFQVNSAVLFPTCDDGIGGELVWTRYPFGDVVAGRVAAPVPADGPNHVPTARMRVADTHDGYVEAWRRGDVDGMVRRLSEDCRWQRRVRDATTTSYISTTGHAETRRAFEGALGGGSAITVEILNRIVTEWYVFCDAYLEIDDGGAEPLAVRHIALHPVDDSAQLRAELGDMNILTTRRGAS